MKKKGFTLIELLAVIIILAIVALIATPVVLNIIEKIRISAAESSAKGYTKAVEYKIMNDGIFDNISYDGEYDVIDNDLNVSYQGSGPSEGNFVVEKNKVTYGEFCINGYPIKYENDYGKYAPGEISCNGEPVIKEPEGTELRELCKDSESVNKYDEITNFKIKKVEDLVCFSKTVNSGKTYEGKTIMLLSNIDIKDSNSYENSENTLYEDINENGTIEGLLTELTTGKGFKPIGNGSNTFKGTFNGYAFTLSNLYINRPNEIYVGLFGDTSGGIIKGVNVNNIEVIGGQYTGGIVGHLINGTVQEIAVYGKVTGTSNVGGISGYVRSATIENVLVNADVTGTGYVGGINGYGKDAVSIAAIMESGTVTSSQCAGKISCYGYNGTGYASTNVSKSSSQYAGNNGTSYELNNHVMGLYDYVLDTYIGGDNDSSGYYFDYENEESTKIVVKSTELEPIKFNMQGEGTEESPYIISNAKDWKNATLKVKGGYYFKINNDLDFENEKFYMLGTYNNQFDGVLLGNNNTISNVNISGYNSGIVGYLNGGTIKELNIENSSSTGTTNNAGMLVGYSKNGFIEGINLKNITVKGTYFIGGIVGEMSGGGITGVNANNVTITGEQYVGGIVGQLIGNSTVQEIAFYGKVTGTSNVGGISGYVRSATIENVLVNADVTGTGYVGGINGYGKDLVNITAIMESGTVTSSNTAGKIAGYSYNGTGYASTIVKDSSSQYAGHDGTSYELNNHVMGLYDHVLDTYIGGDNDSSGYYFDYENDESTKIVVKSTELEPIKFNLQGEGTESNPYIIANAKDWKNATLKVKGGYYFKINNDLDFENEKFYMLGTYNNQFDGVLLGNNNTISNVNISGYNSGIVGYLNGGTIKDVNIENSSSNAPTNYAGMLVGYNKNGFIEGINLKNITVKGTYFIGGIVGEMSGGGITGVNANNVTITGEQYVGGIVGQLIGNSTVQEIAFYGKVTGTSIVGGISGYIRNATVEKVLVNADVTGTGYVGGINGYGKDSVNITAIMESGTVTSSNTAGKIAGYRYNGLGYASTAVKDSSSQYAGYDGTSYSSDDIQDLGYYATLKYSNMPIIESSITGDINNTGYYFGYGNDGNIWVVKVGSAEPGGSTNPEEPGTNPTIEIDHNYTMTSIVGTTDTEAPTCELYYVVPVSNGIRASFSCTDNSGAPIVRSLFDSTTEKSAATFDTIGTLKSGSVSGNTKTVISTWNVNNPISQPTPGTCYYFRYGGQDVEGNFSTYVTNICYTGFSN